MFEEYTSIDDVMRDHGQEVAGMLNDTSLYLEIVKQMDYHEIGIIVCDDQWNEISRYASLNNGTGEITEIVREFDDPGIMVKVNGRTLMSILHNIDHVKKHPFESFFAYAPDFRPGRPIKDAVQLPALGWHMAMTFGKK